LWEGRGVATAFPKREREERKREKRADRCAFTGECFKDTKERRPVGNAPLSQSGRKKGKGLRISSVEDSPPNLARKRRKTLPGLTLLQGKREEKTTDEEKGRLPRGGGKGGRRRSRFLVCFERGKGKKKHANQKVDDFDSGRVDKKKREQEGVPHYDEEKKKKGRHLGLKRDPFFGPRAEERKNNVFNLIFSTLASGGEGEKKKGWQTGLHTVKTWRKKKGGVTPVVYLSHNIPYL